MSYMGNIPVPGVVTSRRNRDVTKAEKNKLTERKKAESTRDEELKKSQAEVMRYLAAKKKVGDEPGLEHARASARRFREATDDGAGGDADRNPDKRARKEDRRDSRSPHRGQRDGRRQRDDLDGSHRDDDSRRRRDSDVRDGGDRQHGQKASHRFEEGADSPRGDGGVDFSEFAPPKPASSWEALEEEDDAEEEQEDVGRRSKLASAFALQRDDEKAAADKQLAAETKAKRQLEDKARKRKLAGAFGMDDEDDDEARRNLEFVAAAAAKRAAAKRQMIANGSGSSSLVPQAAQATGGPLDAYQALKKMAEFKRACNGATRTIPSELKAMVMQVSRNSG